MEKITKSADFKPQTALIETDEVVITIVVRKSARAALAWIEESGLDPEKLPEPRLEKEVKRAYNVLSHRRIRGRRTGIGKPI